MTTLSEIYLEAVNPAAGCSRAYRITVTQDLFGVYVVETRYGRIGSYGHSLSRSFVERDAARGFVDVCLRRRQSAPRRIGTEYVVKSVWEAAA